MQAEFAQCLPAGEQFALLYLLVSGKLLPADLSLQLFRAEVVLSWSRRSLIFIIPSLLRKTKKRIVREIPFGF